MIRSHSLLVALLLIGSCQRGADSQTNAMGEPRH
jgi:hypothetical protein